MTVSTWFPHSPAELTPAWLTDSLRSAGALGGDGEVAGFTVALLGEGAGMMGTVTRIVLDYDGAAGPPSVIAKFSTTDPHNQDVAASIDLYRREVSFYVDLAPEVRGRCPRCYRAEMQEDGRACVLLLEDFPRHRVGDQVEGASLQDATACMVEAARLHAAHWGAPRPAAAPPYAEGHGAIMQHMATSLWDVMVERYASVLPNDLPGLKDEYLGGLGAFQGWLSNTAPNTIAHGDFRLDNLLFGPAGDPDPVVMVDFQAPQWSKGVQDLSYLLTQSLEVDLRRQHERALLGVYCDELARLGVVYDPEACWEDYRRAALVNFAVAIAIGCGLAAPNDRARRFMSSTIERAGTTFDDLGLRELLRAGVRGA